jgi:hypothetical protein
LREGEAGLESGEGGIELVGDGLSGG